MQQQRLPSEVLRVESNVVALPEHLGGGIAGVADERGGSADTDANAGTRASSNDRVLDVLLDIRTSLLSSDPDLEVNVVVLLQVNPGSEVTRRNNPQEVNLRVGRSVVASGRGKLNSLRVGVRDTSTTSEEDDLVSSLEGRGSTVRSVESDLVLRSLREEERLGETLASTDDKIKRVGVGRRGNGERMSLLAGKVGNRDIDILASLPVDLTRGRVDIERELDSVTGKDGSVSDNTARVLETVDSVP